MNSSPDTLPEDYDEGVDPNSYPSAFWAVIRLKADLQGRLPPPLWATSEPAANQLAEELAEVGNVVLIAKVEQRILPPRSLTIEALT